MTDDTVFIGQGGGAAQALRLPLANRHGLIAGATGTGKTVTLQGLAEGFSAAGVPVFLADVKGDLAGLAFAGSSESPLHAKLAARAADMALDWRYEAFPVMFWDLYGEAGHPVRT
ncbi:MAG TPA: helicase HerA-like domain-containing protein, partial [Sphingomonadaceae bacterium]|nr:helicase HerA-like domain-containing protein [Sphingomonadaceae bacterium]